MAAATPDRATIEEDARDVVQMPAARRADPRAVSRACPRARQMVHVDIHCHVLTPKAAEMVAGNAAATRHPREVYANERTREVNRQQAERNRIQFT